MIKEEIDLAFDRLDLESKHILQRQNEIKSNFQTGNEVELGRLYLKKTLLNNFRLDYFIEADTGNFFVNQSVTTEKLPFYNSGKSIHVGRYDSISLDMSMARRKPTILNRYKRVYSIHGKEPTILKGVLPNSEDRSIVESEYSGMIVDEKFRSTAIELFGERIEKDLVNIYGMFDSEQMNIIKKYKQNTSMWISGFAGTGKTLIALELFVKGSVNKNPLALFANKDGADKANRFFKEINQPQVAVSYETANNKLSTKVHDYFKKLSIITYNLPFSDALRDINISCGNDKFKFKEIPNCLLNFEFDGSDYEKICLIKKVIELYGTQQKYFSEKIIDKIYNDIKSYKIDTFDLKLKGKTYIEIYNSEFLYKILEPLKYDLLLLDEAPIITSYQYIALKVRRATINERIITISSFDEFQYSEKDRNNIWKYIHYDLKGSLDVIYRTTKEIFSEASKGFISKKWIAPVSIPNSFTNGDTLEKVIKLSWAVENYMDLIGLEYKELTIIEDIDPNNVDNYILYMIRTRAVQKLSIMKEGKKWELPLY